MIDDFIEAEIIRNEKKNGRRKDLQATRLEKAEEEHFLDIFGKNQFKMLQFHNTPQILFLVVYVVKREELSPLTVVGEEDLPLIQPLGCPQSKALHGGGLR